MMCLFMVYLFSMYILNFVIIGATFSAIVIFLSYSLNNLFLESNSTFLNDLANSQLTSQIFFGIYLILIFIVLLVSLSLPVERGMSYFRFTICVFSLLSIVAVAGIIYFMSQTGFVIQEMIYNPNSHKY